MSISIVSRPIAQIEASNASNWNASENPIIYNIKREDQEILNVDDDSGFARVNLTVDLTGSLVVGDSIYISSGVYEIGGKITDITATTITTDITFTTTSSGGYINYRQNYRVLVEFIDPDTGFKKFNSQFRVRTRPNGELELDLHEKLKTLLISTDSYDYTGINQKDENLSTKFYIQLTEFYTGVSPTTPDIIDSSNVIFVTLSAKQIGEIYGGNMGEYVPFPTSTVSSENRAKWLTKFDQIKMWEGWPFDISFIYGEELVGFELFRYQEFLDNNDNVISTQNDLLDEEGIEGINRLQVSSVPQGSECLLLSLYNKGSQGEYELSEYESSEYNV